MHTLINYKHNFCDMALRAAHCDIFRELENGGENNAVAGVIHKRVYC